MEILEFVLDNDNMNLESKMSYIMYIQKMSNKIVNKITLSNKNILLKIEICDKYIYYKNLLETKNIKIDECLFFNLSNFFIKKFKIRQ